MRAPASCASFPSAPFPPTTVLRLIIPIRGTCKHESTCSVCFLSICNHAPHIHNRGTCKHESTCSVCFLSISNHAPSPTLVGTHASTNTRTRTCLACLSCLLPFHQQPCVSPSLIGAHASTNTHTRTCLACLSRPLPFHQQPCASPSLAHAGLGEWRRQSPRVNVRSSQWRCPPHRRDQRWEP